MADQASIISIANAQGFWGDQPSAAARLARQAPSLDYLTLDYLAEVSLSIMAIQREKDPSAGFARDFLEVIESLTPTWKSGRRLKVLTNAGGLNPRGCAEAVVNKLKQAGLSHLKVGMMIGDDVLPAINNSSIDPHDFRNFDTQEPISTVAKKLVSANAYVGAESLVDLIKQDVDIIVTGRLADPSLVVAPCVAHFGWSMSDYDKLAGAAVAGHLIECGTQATGGISDRWLQLLDQASLGFPIVEMSPDGSCVLTKPACTGGEVCVATAKEQLLYEMSNPRAFMTPDVTIAVDQLTLAQVAQDRVRVSGATGTPPPSTYKVSATYKDGYATTGMLTITGAKAAEKAKKAGDALLERLRQDGLTFERSLVEVLGTGASVPGVLIDRELEQKLVEVVLRVSVADHDKNKVDRFTKEIAPLVTCGPPGVTGYATGRPNLRPLFGYWPCLIKRELVKLATEVL